MGAFMRGIRAMTLGASLAAMLAVSAPPAVAEDVPHHFVLHITSHDS